MFTFQGMGGPSGYSFALSCVCFCTCDLPVRHGLGQITYCGVAAVAKPRQQLHTTHGLWLPGGRIPQKAGAWLPSQLVKEAGGEGLKLDT